MPQVRHDAGRQKVKTAMIKSVVLATALVVTVSASAKEQMISPELLFRVTTNSPLELKVTAVNGSTIDLEKLRGKVVLLDFWATWCGPCLKELPNVLAAYNKFHGKGFEIIGISLDQDKESLIKFIKARGITWPQHLDETKQISQRFKIEGIPTMWLINKQGLVVNVNARDDLQGSVEKLLAQ
jgi:peroxiredoxin